MIERHRSNRRWITAERLAQLREVKADPGRAKDACETDSFSKQVPHPDWALIATLTFTILVWTAFVFCIYAIWAKCRSSSPF